MNKRYGSLVLNMSDVFNLSQQYAAGITYAWRMRVALEAPAALAGALCCSSLAACRPRHARVTRAASFLTRAVQLGSRARLRRGQRVCASATDEPDVAVFRFTLARPALRPSPRHACREHDTDARACVHCRASSGLTTWLCPRHAKLAVSLATHSPRTP